MSTRIVSTRKLEQALIAQGLIPDHCRLLDVVIAVNDPLIIRYERFVTGDDLQKFATAFAAAVQAIAAEDAS